MLVDNDGFRVAAYDVFSATGGGIAGISNNTARRISGLTHEESLFLLLDGDTTEEINPLWDKLSTGASVIAPLVTAQGASSPYGMLTDRFGITWIVDVTPTH